MKLGDENSRSAMFQATSKKNATTVPLSSCGSELAASVEVTKDIIFNRGFAEELGFPQTEPTGVKEDNASLIKIASDYSKGSKKMRQSMQLIHFIMDNIKREMIEMQKIEGLQHAADNLTKPVAPKGFWKHIVTLMGAHPDIEEARKRAGQAGKSSEEREGKQANETSESKRKEIMERIAYTLTIQLEGATDEGKDE